MTNRKKEGKTERTENMNEIRKKERENEWKIER